jgi:hypothetical protein
MRLILFQFNRIQGSSVSMWVTSLWNEATTLLLIQLPKSSFSSCYKDKSLLFSQWRSVNFYTVSQAFYCIQETYVMCLLSQQSSVLSYLMFVHSINCFVFSPTLLCAGYDIDVWRFSFFFSSRILLVIFLAFHLFGKLLPKCQNLIFQWCARSSREPLTCWSAYLH